MIMKNVKQINCLTVISILLLCSGCDKQMKTDDYVPEFAKIEAEEVGEHHIFESNAKFEFSTKILAEMKAVLKDAKANGIDNIAFMLISNKPVSIEDQEKVRKHITSLMYKEGFMRSRVIDRGVCVYKDAKPSVRISILDYKVKEPDCSLWSEYIGDTDTNKNLPKYGISNVYNLDAMIANKADLVTPREYRGQETSAAISAISSVSSGGSIGGSGGSSGGSSSSGG